MAAQMLASDARGVDTYHACGTFTTAQSRRAANAGWFKCFMSDVDVGEGKPYATIDEAICACDQFCDRLTLPLPGMVRSGSGLHLYWPLDRVLTREEWLPLAHRLKLLMQTHGLHADPSRTADAASILRPPGTHNYKLSYPREVTIDDPDVFFEELSCDEITQVIINSPCGSAQSFINKGLMDETLNSRVNSSGNVANVARLATAGHTGQAASSAGHNHSLTAGISKAFDPAVGVAQGSRGSMRVRYAGELVAKGYPWDEVYARVKAWDGLCQPPEGEAGVHHSVKSAFSMHAAKHPKVAPLPVAQGAEPLPVAPGAEPLVAIELADLDMPNGFRWGNAGQLLGRTKKKLDDGTEQEDWQVVSFLPVHLGYWLKEEGYKAKFSYLFAHRHPLDGWQSFTMEATDFNGNNWYGKMTEKGISLAEGGDKLFKSYIRRLENMRKENGQSRTLFSQFGWKDNNTAFLVGDDLFKPDGKTEKIVGTNTLTPMINAMKLHKGSSDEWAGIVGGFNGPTLEAQRFMIGLSMAAPLMQFALDDGNGGSVISFVTGKSGGGKTPGALAAASVWGEKSAIMVSGNTTDNRFIDDITRRCHLPIIQDERHPFDPEHNATFVKNISAGVNRARLTSGGTPTEMPEIFKTIVMTIANTSLLNSVKRAPGGDAMSKRVFEIELEIPDKSELERLGGLAQALMRHAGMAGRKLVKAYVHPDFREYIQFHLASRPNGDPGYTVAKYWERLGTSAEHRFIAAPIACYDVAVRIAQHIGLLHFDLEAQLNWICKKARYRIADVSGDSWIEKFSLFLSEHPSMALRVDGPYVPKKGPCLMHNDHIPHKVIMRVETKYYRMFIAQNAISDWCDKQGLSYHQLSINLQALGVITKTSEPATLGAGTGVDTGRTSCWVIDLANKHLTGNEEVQAAVVGGTDMVKANA